MGARVLPRLARLAFALVATAAVAGQLLDDAARGTLDPVNFFSHFTIQTNLLGAAAFILVALQRDLQRRPLLDLIRGAVTVYLTVTLAAYALLLAGPTGEAGGTWMNTVLHRLFPLVVILDWVFAPPATPISFRHSLVWLAYPIVWMAYTMVRGLLIGWYPYWFIDPAERGYATVALYVAAIFVLAIALCGLVSAVSRWRGESEAASARATA